jgi:hypothetical protein
MEQHTQVGDVVGEIVVFGNHNRSSVTRVPPIGAGGRQSTSNGASPQPVEAWAGGCVSGVGCGMAPVGGF